MFPQWGNRSARKKFTFVLLVVLLCLPLTRIAPLQAPPATFQAGSTLRDAEIEETLWTFLTPILRVAGLNHNSVKLFVIFDPTVNAFATFGPLVVVYSGLLLRCKRVEELLAVLAHEIGHIRGVHIPKGIDAYKKAMTSYLLGAGLGVLAAILGGNPAAATLGLGLGAQVSTRNLLAFSRVQETEADLIAFEILHKLNWPVDGAVSLFQMFADMTGSVDASAAYTMTHPLSQERKRLAEKNIRRGDKLPADFQSNFARLQAKLLAYTLKPQDVTLHPKLAASSNKLMARRVAAYRQGDFDTTQKLLAKELKARPNDPYLHEFAAQFYFEKGAIPKARTAMARAMRLTQHPHSSFLLLQARILLAEDGAASKHSKEVTRLLQTAVLQEPYSPEPWYFLSTLAGKAGEPGRARFYLAEYNVRRGRIDEAESQLKQARKLLGDTLKKDAKLKLQIEDLEKALTEEKRGRKTASWV